MLLTIFRLRLGQDGHMCFASLEELEHIIPDSWTRRIEVHVSITTKATIMTSHAQAYIGVEAESLGRGLILRQLMGTWSSRE